MNLWKLIEQELNKKDLSKSELYNMFSEIISKKSTLKDNALTYQGFTKKFRDNAKMTVEELLIISYILDIDLKAIQLAFNTEIDTLEDSYKRHDLDIKSIKRSSHYYKEGCSVYTKSGVTPTNEEGLYILTIHGNSAGLEVVNFPEATYIVRLGKIDDLSAFLLKENISLDIFYRMNDEDKVDIIFRRLYEIKNALFSNYIYDFKPVYTKALNTISKLNFKQIEVVTNNIVTEALTTNYELASKLDILSNKHQLAKISADSITKELFDDAYRFREELENLQTLIFIFESFKPGEKIVLSEIHIDNLNATLEFSINNPKGKELSFKIINNQRLIEEISVTLPDSDNNSTSDSDLLSKLHQLVYTNLLQYAPSDSNYPNSFAEALSNNLCSMQLANNEEYQLTENIICLLLNSKDKLADNSNYFSDELENLLLTNKNKSKLHAEYFEDNRVEDIYTLNYGPFNISVDYIQGAYFNEFQLDANIYLSGLDDEKAAHSLCTCLYNDIIFEHTTETANSKCKRTFNIDDLPKILFNSLKKYIELEVKSRLNF